MTLQDKTLLPSPNIRTNCSESCIDSTECVLIGAERSGFPCCWDVYSRHQGKDWSDSEPTAHRLDWLPNIIHPDDFHSQNLSPLLLDSKPIHTSSYFSTNIDPIVLGLVTWPSLDFSIAFSSGTLICWDIYIDHGAEHGTSKFGEVGVEACLSVKCHEIYI